MVEALREAGAEVLGVASIFTYGMKKGVERMAEADGDMPAMDHASLMDVLKRIDNVMEWRFVNALGEVVLDADILAESIDCETLRSMRQCVVNAIVDIEEAEEGRDE